MNILTLRHPDLGKKISSFYEELKSNETLVQLFVHNPSEIITQKLLPDELQFRSRQNVDRANRLLFSVLSNKDFFKWIETYQEDIKRTLAANESFEVDEKKVLQDFSKAIIQYGNEPMLMSLIRSPEDPKDLSTPMVLVFYIMVAVIVLAWFWFWVAGAISPDSKDTIKISKTYGISVSQLRAIAQQLVAHAERLNKEGKLIDPHYKLG